jgi:hypothetical protein
MFSNLTHTPFDSRSVPRRGFRRRSDTCGIQFLVTMSIGGDMPKY